jgi:hypothetical protein
MGFIKINRAESVEPVKKDDQKIASVTTNKALLQKLREALKGK